MRKLGLCFFLIVLYFSLRIPSLTEQPIFADEAIYIRWAQVMRAEPTLRFLPLSDGKTPLFMWALIPGLKVIKDPLLAGRLLSVLAGFLSVVGIFAIGWRFFNLRVALLGAFLMVVTPMIIFFDRMALVDSMLSGFHIWSLFLGLLIVSRPRIDLGIALGYTFGLGMLTKTPGIFSIWVLPVTLALFKWKANKRALQLFKLAGIWTLAIAVAMAIYNVLRLGPGFSNLASRNRDYVHPLTRLLEYPLDPFIPHLRDLADWFPKLLTLPVIMVSLGAFVLSFFKKSRLVWVILAWGLIPLLVEMALLKTFTARYILFTIPSFLLAGAWFADWIISKSINKAFATFAFVVLVLGFVINFDIKLLADPLNTPLPKEERIGYLEDWTAGYGLKEIASVLALEAAKYPIVVGTEGSFGTLPDGLFIYLDKVANISIVPGKAEISGDLYEAAREHPTFFVGNKARLPKHIESVQLIKEYPKLSTDGLGDAIYFYKILPLKASP